MKNQLSVEKSVLSRRQFIEGMALGAMAISFGFSRTSIADAVEKSTGKSAIAQQLFVGESSVNFTGKARKAVTINNSLPAPVLRFREGDELLIQVNNTLKEDTSIHWHGLLVPAAMDGVPGFSFEGINRVNPLPIVSH